MAAQIRLTREYGRRVKSRFAVSFKPGSGARYESAGAFPATDPLTMAAVVVPRNPSVNSAAFPRICQFGSNWGLYYRASDGTLRGQMQDGGGVDRSLEIANLNEALVRNRCSLLTASLLSGGFRVFLDATEINNSVQTGITAGTNKLVVGNITITTQPADVFDVVAVFLSNTTAITKTASAIEVFYFMIAHAFQEGRFVSDADLDSVGITHYWDAEDLGPGPQPAATWVARKGGVDLTRIGGNAFDVAAIPMAFNAGYIY